MSSRKRSWWHRYVPSHASNPFRLAMKLATAKEPAARSALLMAGAGILLSPLDFLLRPFERRIYEQSSAPEKPVIIVVGPPRSGTTLLAQYLINSLQVCYVNNLTSLFPHAPIKINRLLKRAVPLRSGDYQAFYGKSRGLAGANDALYIWDRWLGADRETVPTALVPDSSESMPRFFGALTDLYEMPVVNKANRLNTCANLVAEALDNAWFLCLQRDPLYLAQSLYIARSYISGDMKSAYGVRYDNAVPDDPVEDVCQQVLFHEMHAQRQQEILGPDKFSIVSYEEFCNRPTALVDSIANQHPELKTREGFQSGQESFAISSKQKLPDAIFERLKQRLHELGAGKINCRDF